MSVVSFTTPEEEKKDLDQTRSYPGGALKHLSDRDARLRIIFNQVECA